MIAVVGANGMLGSDLCKFLKSQSRNFVPLDIGEIDITDAVSVRNVLTEVNPKLIINCAAYTNVDGAEDNEEAAFLANHIGPKNLAEFADAGNRTLCHMSTDYIFDGTNQTPYKEDAAANPLSVYGMSKLAGEDEVRKVARHYIIRTAWLYGRNGKNFVTTIIEAAGKRDELNVVDDQKGSPTYTVDMARRIMEITDNLPFGTYNSTNSGETTWYELAKKTLNIKQITTTVKPISSNEYPSKVVRPQYSVLSNDKVEQAGLAPMPHWEDALARFLAEV